MDLKLVLEYAAAVLAGILVVVAVRDGSEAPPMAPGPRGTVTANAPGGRLLSVDEPAGYCWNRLGWSDRCATGRSADALP